jgi:hypothetical protein
VLIIIGKLQQDNMVQINYLILVEVITCSFGILELLVMAVLDVRGRRLML